MYEGLKDAQKVDLDELAPKPVDHETIQVTVADDEEKKPEEEEEPKQ